MKPRFIDANKIKIAGISAFNDGEEILVPLSDVINAIRMTPTEDVIPIKKEMEKESCI